MPAAKWASVIVEKEATFFMRDRIPESGTAPLSALDGGNHTGG
jgi:hypothetical protein